DLLELSEWNHRERILRAAQKRSTLGADADNPEVNALDLDRLLERIRGAEQPVGDFPPHDGHRARVFNLDRAHQASALGVEHREAAEVGTDSLNGDAVDGLVLVDHLSAAVRIEHDGR